MKKIILILIILTVIIAGCKKYPDGPLISFRSAKNRLYGDYTLTKYTVDGLDSLSLYHDSLSLNFDFYYNDVYRDNVCVIDGKRKDGKFTNLVCTWKLMNNNKIFKILTAFGNKGSGAIGCNKNLEWKILKHCCPIKKLREGSCKNFLSLFCRFASLKTIYNEQNYIFFWTVRFRTADFFN